MEIDPSKEERDSNVNDALAAERQLHARNA
jgi:hypothetical protein